MEDIKQWYIATVEENGISQGPVITRSLEETVKYKNAGWDCYVIEKMRKIESIECFACYEEALELPFKGK